MNCHTCRESIGFDPYIILKQGGVDYREDGDRPTCLPCLIGELKKQAPVLEERKKAKAASDQFFVDHMKKFRESKNAEREAVDSRGPKADAAPATGTQQENPKADLLRPGNDARVPAARPDGGDAAGKPAVLEDVPII